jgi:hypothetical protein
MKPQAWQMRAAVSTASFTALGAVVLLSGWGTMALRRHDSRCAGFFQGSNEMTSYRRLSLAVLLSVTATTAWAQGFSARYPDRIPDWLWDRPVHQHLLPVDVVTGLRADIVKLAALREQGKADEAVALGTDLARRLSARFSARDLAVDATVVRNPRNGATLAVQLDPAFSAEARGTLLKAAQAFVDSALDRQVIRRAFDRSTLKPAPWPAEFVIKEGKPVLDALQRPTYTDAHGLIKVSRVRPDDALQFERHLHSVLVPAGPDPTLLVISSYRGNPWWGAGRYGFHANPAQQLARESPPQGYLYIRLNTDKLAAPEPGWNDAAFWASKIAHESLHTLGYWHPEYPGGPAERDANNGGSQWAFIVSYEMALLDSLKRDAP